MLEYLSNWEINVFSNAIPELEKFSLANRLISNSICNLTLCQIGVLNRPHKILAKTIGEISVNTLGYTNPNYPVDDLISI